MSPRLQRFGLMFAALAAVLSIEGPAFAQDAAKGQAIFNENCAGCHNIAKTGGDSSSLSLFGVVGRKAGAVAGFSYSSDLSSSGITWTPDKLDAFIASPTTLVPGTQMYFSGLPDAPDRANLIAYLKTLH